MPAIPKHNNFDFLRFCFAVMVLFAHASTLSQASELTILNRLFSAEVAVQSFFVVSGFLIFMSYENSNNLREYFQKRVRRIYPAYFLVVLACAFLGGVLTELKWSEYLYSHELYKYFIYNLIFLNFLQPSLPGVFESHYIAAVNGALWTLKIEVMFYLSVPVLVWFMKRFGAAQVLFFSYFASFCYWLVMEVLVDVKGAFYLEMQRQLPGQLMYFVAGGSLFYYFHYFKRYAIPLGGFALTVLIFNNSYQLTFLYPLSLAILVILTALVFPQFFNFGRYGDFSYGIYILHFPVLQTIIAMGFFSNPWMGFCCAVITTMTLSICMWHFVEKPMLKSTSHYVKVNQAQPK